MLKHTGSKIGKSIYENNCGNLIKEILKIQKNIIVTFFVQLMYRLAKSLEGKGKKKYFIKSIMMK